MLLIILTLSMTRLETKGFFVCVFGFVDDDYVGTVARKVFLFTGKMENFIVYPLLWRSGDTCPYPGLRKE